MKKKMCGYKDELQDEWKNGWKSESKDGWLKGWKYKWITLGDESQSICIGTEVSVGLGLWIICLGPRDT